MSPFAITLKYSRSQPYKMMPPLLLSNPHISSFRVVLVNCKARMLPINANLVLLVGMKILWP
jgi:hypothetical protein